jgi:hypothetical protein
MIIVEHITDERPTDADIVAFEKLIRGSLPNDYKAFLKAENGGEPEPQLFRSISANQEITESALRYLSALCKGLGGEANLKSDLECYEDRILPGFVSIGCDDFGNQIVLGVSDDNRGKVYFWDHEEEGDEPTFANMSFVANSFSEFIKSLFNPYI